MAGLVVGGNGSGDGRERNACGGRISISGGLGHTTIGSSVVSRMVNLTTLAPDIVAAILDDTLPNHTTLFDLAVDPPALWDEQRERIKDGRYRGTRHPNDRAPSVKRMPVWAPSIRGRYARSVR